MSDKMRGALFNVLGDISGLSVLDAFAGSGALSFEAASRGALQVTAIEKDATAQRSIETARTELRLGNQVQLIKASAAAWLSTTTDSFSIVLLDPPYDDLQTGLLARLVARTAEGGFVCLSWPGDTPAPDFTECRLVQQKNYGDGQLLFFRRREL